MRELESACSKLRTKLLAFKNLEERFEKIRDAQVGVLAHRIDVLENNVEGLTLHLHETFYPRLLAAIAGRRWLLTHGIKLAVIKCLNSLDYVAASGKVISSAIIKGIQEGLEAGLAHSKLGTDLSSIAAHYPSAEADYQSALQALRDFEFPLWLLYWLTRMPVL